MMKKNETGKVIKWQWIWAILALFTLLTFLIYILFPKSIILGSISWVLFIALALFAVFTILYTLVEQQNSINRSYENLSTLLEMYKKQQGILDQISNDIRLTETTKSIAYREADRLKVGEAVLNKLHQKDFPATYDMIEAIESKTEYRGLAMQLRKAADKYKNASDEERIEQIISHIEQLADEQHWDQASVQARKLMRWYPDSPKAKGMPAKLRDLKEAKKRQFLKQWEEATNMEDTDRSLEILKELDKYLTPSEGLAMQEAVSGVFKAKLQSLGVRFSLAVSDKKWDVALETGEEIMRNFPNSLMAHEIKSKINILRSKAK